MGRTPQKETTNSRRNAPDRTARSARLFSRRTLLGHGAALAAAGVGTALTPFFVRPAHAAGNTLNVLTWTGYVPDGFVKAFHKATGITATITTVGSNEEMLTQGRDLSVGPSQNPVAGTQHDPGLGHGETAQSG